MEWTDAELLERLAMRDEQALRVTIDRYGAIVFGAARWLVKDEGTAEEVAQDTFVTLWRRPGAVDPSKGNLRSFLTGVAKHKAIDRIRSAAAHARTIETTATSPQEVASDIGDTVAERGSLLQALSRLTHVQREALVLAYLGGRTYKEVARELDVPEGTAKTRLRDGLMALRSALLPMEAGV
jgi:RNA polymerase sigma-70 factor (ECF subfamily)